MTRGVEIESRAASMAGSTAKNINDGETVWIEDGCPTGACIDGMVLQQSSPR